MLKKWENITAKPSCYEPIWEHALVRGKLSRLLQRETGETHDGLCGECATTMRVNGRLVWSESPEGGRSTVKATSHDKHSPTGWFNLASKNIQPRETTTLWERPISPSITNDSPPRLSQNEIKSHHLFFVINTASKSSAFCKRTQSDFFHT